MTAAQPRAPRGDAARPDGLALAHAAASAHPDDGQRIVSWGFPAPPAPVVEAAGTAWGVTVVSNASATDPRSLPAFGLLFARDRSEQIVRALARRTNLVLPAATALVVGDGPLASTIASTLAAGGSRVHRGIADPIARLSAHLAGARLADSPWRAADLVIATGEGHAPLDATALTGVMIDASAGGSAIRIDELGESVRPFVRRIGQRRWIVDAPELYESGDGVKDGTTRTADLLIALSILHARTPGGDVQSADRLLAELVTA